MTSRSGATLHQTLEDETGMPEIQHTTDYEELQDSLRKLRDKDQSLTDRFDSLKGQLEHTHQ